MAHRPLALSLISLRRANEVRLVRLIQIHQGQIDRMTGEISRCRLRNPRRQLLVPAWRTMPSARHACRNDAWLDQGHGPYYPRKGSRWGFLPSRTTRDGRDFAGRKHNAWRLL